MLESIVALVLGLTILVSLGSKMLEVLRVLDQTDRKLRELQQEDVEDCL